MRRETDGLTRRMRRAARPLAVSVGLLLALPAAPARAHTSLPAYLGLNELAPGTFAVIWRIPAVEGPPPAIVPVLPAHCTVPDIPTEVELPGSVVTNGVVACGETGLAGQTIGIDGLRVTIMDTLVRIQFADGNSVTQILRPQEPSFVVGAESNRRVDGWGYFRLGVDHILSGIDHLLFVFGVLWIVAGFRRLLKAITAFTVAHSITLGLATLGFVRVPPAPVEALVALSIVFLAVEITQRDRGAPSLTYRRPWVVAFAFGLLHGFGFAGTLSQIGIPPGDIPLALLSFNVGVEVGQIAFITAALALFAALRTLEVRPRPWMQSVPAYTIGSLASFWFLQRCATVFG